MLILSSSSPARKELLSRLQLPFTAVSPDIDETPLPGESPQELVTRLAIAKAKVHEEQFPVALIIGSDQVIVIDGIVLGKPGNHENAVKQLKMVSGKHIDSYTGVCLYNTKTQHQQVHVEPFQVYFRELNDEMIENYLQLDKPYQCAGSIRAEKAGPMLFEKMCGDDPTALIGLPLINLVRMLESDYRM